MLHVTGAASGWNHPKLHHMTRSQAIIFAYIKRRVFSKEVFQSDEYDKYFGAGLADLRCRKLGGFIRLEV